MCQSGHGTTSEAFVGIIEIVNDMPQRRNSQAVVRLFLHPRIDRSLGAINLPNLFQSLKSSPADTFVGMIEKGF